MNPLDDRSHLVLPAAVAQHIYLRISMDIGALAKLHGGRSNRRNRPRRRINVRPTKSPPSLEKIGVLELLPDAGRRISQDGQRELGRIATAVVETQKQAADEQVEEDDGEEEYASDLTFFGFLRGTEV